MKDIIAIIILGILLIVIPTFGLIGCTNYVGVEATISKIEQLRSDSAHVDPAQAEDVIGQVTEWNQIISSNKYWNSTAWGFLIPDEWDRVELIPVPR